MGTRTAHEMLPLALLILLPLLATANPVHDIRLKITAGDDAPSDLGIFWEGHFGAERSVQSTDRLVDVLEPGTSTIHKTHLEQSFTLRSSDMKFRVRVAPRDQGSDPQYAHRLFLENMSHDPAESSLELQHGKSNFLWMKRGDKATHRTNPHHDFTFTNSNGVAIATVRLLPVVEL